MLKCFEEATSKAIAKAIPITLMTSDAFPEWLTRQSTPIKNWLKSMAFIARPGAWCLMPTPAGFIEQVLAVTAAADDSWDVGALPALLPPGNYVIKNYNISMAALRHAAIAWGLGAYQFHRYKSSEKIFPKLLISEDDDIEHLLSTVESIFLVRDLINTPTDDMGPAELAAAVSKLGKKYQATVTQIIGEDLLRKNYPAIHAVGRASQRAPRLIDLRWGNKNAPKVTLVGKGVCFDSGGLDIKSSSNMLLMKKDMGGAAHVIGLANMIMAAKLPVRLRVLIPAVENVISGNAYHPGDVLATRKGLSVEIGNTDAEGRVILADALTEAVAEKPELIIDYATLTGAARVALGTDLPALFTNDDNLAAALIAAAQQQQDPLWRLPLFTPYRKLIDSPIADINNAGSSGYAGAITAALFLKEFIPDAISWAHVDLMAWNVATCPGHPEGGEAMAFRAVFYYLQQRFSKKR